MKTFYLDKKRLLKVKKQHFIKREKKNIIKIKIN